MTSTEQTGPLLADIEFFNDKIDATQPGLESIPALMAVGDVAGARQVFAAAVRASLRPDKMPYVEGVRGNTYMYPNETFPEAAERILRLEMISCGTPCQFEGQVDWFANPTYNQYKEWTWQLSRHWEWDVLAEQYRKTGDERFAEGFVKLFQSWVRQAVVPEDVPGNYTLCWRTIEAGIRMGQTWPRVLHSFFRSPHVTDDVLVDWYKSVWEHGNRLRHNYWVFNWRIMEFNGLAQIGILYPQLKDSVEWKAFALNRLERELDLQNFADGFQYELTTGYHQVNIRNYQLLWDVMVAYDEPIPAKFRSELEKMYAVNVRLMMPDGRLPDLNDGKWHDVAPLTEKGVEYFPERADFRWANTNGQEGNPPSEKSLAFPYSGYYVMRTGWERDAVYIFFDGGHLGTNHQHEDKLNVLLHAYGQLLLTEGGNYAYDDSEMRRYVLSTRAHNTIRVDGLDQNRKEPFRARFRDNMPSEEAIIAELNTLNPATWFTSEAYDLAASTYDEGYGSDVARLTTHERKLVFLKQPPASLSPCVLVIDRVESADGQSHDYEALWHLDTNSVEIAQDNPLRVSSADANQANLTLIVADHTALSLEVVSGQEEPEWQGWKSTTSGKQGSELPAPTPIVRWASADAQRVVTLLYATPADTNCPVTRVLADSSVNATAISLMLANGESVELDEGDFSA